MKPRGSSRRSPGARPSSFITLQLPADASSAGLTASPTLPHRQHRLRTPRRGLRTPPRARRPQPLETGAPHEASRSLRMATPVPSRTRRRRGPGWQTRAARLVVERRPRSAARPPLRARLPWPEVDDVSRDTSSDELRTPRGGPARRDSRNAPVLPSTKPPIDPALRLDAPGAAPSATAGFGSAARKCLRSRPPRTRRGAQSPALPSHSYARCDRPARARESRRTRRPARFRNDDQAR